MLERYRRGPHGRFFGCLFIVWLVAWMGSRGSVGNIRIYNVYVKYAYNIYVTYAYNIYVKYAYRMLDPAWQTIELDPYNLHVCIPWRAHEISQWYIPHGIANSLAILSHITQPSISPSRNNSHNRQTSQSQSSNRYTLPIHPTPLILVIVNKSQRTHSRRHIELVTRPRPRNIRRVVLHP